MDQFHFAECILADCKADKLTQADYKAGKRTDICVLLHSIVHCCCPT